MPQKTSYHQTSCSSWIDANSRSTFASSRRAISQQRTAEESRSESSSENFLRTRLSCSGCTSTVAHTQNGDAKKQGGGRETLVVWNHEMTVTLTSYDVEASSAARLLACLGRSTHFRQGPDSHRLSQQSLAHRKSVRFDSWARSWGACPLSPGCESSGR